MHPRFRDTSWPTCETALGAATDDDTRGLVSPFVAGKLLGLPRIDLHVKFISLVLATSEFHFFVHIWLQPRLAPISE